MDFKELQTFNEAILMKMAWRIYQRTNSLPSRVLKGIYFPEDEFLEARKGPRATWMWSSFMEGKEKLKEGALWRIGDGDNVRIWKDAWVTGIHKQRLVLRNGGSEVSDMRVCCLIDSEMWCWKLNMLEGQISAEEVKAIEKIPLPRSNKIDKLVWPLEGRREVTVKSTYAFLRQSSQVKDSRKCSSSHLIENVVLKSIWKVNCLPNVKNFFRRVMSDVIAVNKCRGMNVSDKCYFC